MERILQRWYDMISIRSVNGHEAQMADYVANVLRELGMDPHYSYFEEDTARERPSVWSVLDSGRPGKTVLLVGHLDTVDVSDRWKTDPFTPTEIDGKVYGRGHRGAADAPAPAPQARHVVRALYGGRQSRHARCAGEVLPLR